MPAEALDDARADPVSAAPAVAEQQPRLGRDDIGRVRHHEIEPLARDRRVEVALAPLDVAHAVESRVEAGERERARVEVRADDVLGVARGEQGLDAPAAAEVEHAPGVAADGQAREQERRRADAEHVVRRDGEGDRVGAVAREDQALGHRERHEGTDVAGLDLQQPEARQVLGLQRRERRPRVGFGDRLVQREQADQRVQGALSGQPPEVERPVDVAVLGADRRPERRAGLGPRVAVAVEHGAQAGDEVLAAGVEHRGPTLSPGASERQPGRAGSQPSGLHSMRREP